MHNSKQNILKTLAYFNIFQYPLTKEEICHFHCSAITQAEIDEILPVLVADSSIFMLGEFYSLQNDPALAERRRKGNSRAAEQMKKAARAAGILSRFPYVKGLAISGSLSKKYADEKTDIDFFIITTANRLWIARSLMHLYKKFTFLTGRQHWFCMNYYIDEANLDISEKNIFTAMEIITLIPMYGATSLQQFNMANNWTNAYFPLFIPQATGIPEVKNSLFKRLTEKIFGGRLGDSTDNLLMKITDRRWKRKTRLQKRTEKGDVVSMAVDKHYSKPNPQNFQEKVIEKYQSKINSLFVQQTQLQPQR